MTEPADNAAHNIASQDDQGLVRVLAAVISRDGQYLVCKRPAWKRHGGRWEFPGGKLEAGETMEAAGRRELAEELGVEVDHVGTVLASIHDPGSIYVIEFVEVAISGEPVALEHEEVTWARPEQLVDFELAPSDRRFLLEKLLPDLLSN